MMRQAKQRWSMMLVPVALLASSLGGCRGGQPVPSDASTRTTGAELAPIGHAAEPLRADVQRARELIRGRKLDEALTAVEQVLAQQPKRVDALLLLGDIHRLEGRNVKAARAYERAATLQPGSLDAHFRLGVVRHRLDLFAEASESYLKTLAMDPDHFGANARLAQAYLELGRAVKAEPYARNATRLRPQDQNAWTQLARATYRSSRHAEAITAYTRAGKLGPLSDHDQMDFAAAHANLDEYAKVVELLEALVDRLGSADGYERLGYAQFKLKQHEAAISSFRAALLRDADMVAAMNGLAVSLMTRYVRTGSTNARAKDEALKLWRRSIKLKPDQPKILKLIGRIEG
jgi:tetratricopeptide (TPR) repeat protein